MAGRGPFPKSVFYGHFRADMWVVFKPPYLRATTEVGPEIGLEGCCQCAGPLRTGPIWTLWERFLSHRINIAPM